MNRSTRIACIVGAMAAILLALAAPSAKACDECQREALRLQQIEQHDYSQVERVRVEREYEYVEPLVERVIRRERVIVEPEYVEPVCVERVRVEHVRRAPVVRSLRIERVREPRRSRSKSVQIERIRGY